MRDLNRQTQIVRGDPDGCSPNMTLGEVVATIGNDSTGIMLIKGN